MSQASNNTLAAPTVPDLTFGIELEFVLIGKCSEIEQHLGDELGSWETANIALVYEALVSNGIPVRDVEEDIGDGFFNDAFGDDQPSAAEKFQKWNLAVDCSVRLTEAEEKLLPPDYHAGSVELKSPIYSLRQRYSWHTEISHVLSTLHRTLNSPSPTTGPCPSTRLLTNETCALHIHVGKSPDASRVFTLRTLQNLLQLGTAFERLIDELHSADRIKNIPPPNTTSTSTSPSPSPSDQGDGLSFFAPPSATFRHHPDPRLAHGSALDWCAAIDAAGDPPSPSPSPVPTQPDMPTDMPIDSTDTDMPTLAHRRLTNSSRYVTYNLANAIHPGIGAPFAGEVGGSTSTAFFSDNDDSADSDDRRRSFYWTVEFRQHRGTLEAGAVFAWVDVVTRMVGVAEGWADADAEGEGDREEGEGKRARTPLWGLLAERWADVGFTAGRWLGEVLGVEGGTMGFYEGVWGRRECDGDEDEGGALGVDALVRRNEVDAARVRGRRAVLRAVLEKLLAGGHGAFSRGVLEELRGDLEARLAVL
ncbi:amidoligase enzyme [Diplodia corticola]|uniref:Amidoligase enzyme n=1 Tax=Diplodia corticola TaxID=236234 RepID=A0A1J9S0H4_9PEZI|nr:amidoligase enzyme [Diplodia corticola]OJD33524.1 amidoligase enzyme [Diplodia corticola]